MYLNYLCIHTLHRELSCTLENYISPQLTTAHAVTPHSTPCLTTLAAWPLLALPRPAAAPLYDAPRPGLRHAARRVHQQPVQHLVTCGILLFIYVT